MEVKARFRRRGPTPDVGLVRASGTGLGRPYFLGAAVLAVGLAVATFIATRSPVQTGQSGVLSVVVATAAATTTVPTGLLLLARYRLGGRRSEVDAGLIVLLLGAFWLFPKRVGPLLVPGHVDLLEPFTLAVVLVVLVLARSAGRMASSDGLRLKRRLAVALCSALALGCAGLLLQSVNAALMTWLSNYVGLAALALSAGTVLLAGYRSERWSLTFIGLELLGLEMGELFASSAAGPDSNQWLAASFLALVGATIGTLGALAVALSSADEAQQELLGATVDRVRMLQSQATTEERLHDLRAGLFSVEAFAATFMPSAGRTSNAGSAGSVDLLVAELSRLRELVSAERRSSQYVDLSDGVRQLIESRRAAGLQIVDSVTRGLEVFGVRGEICEVAQNLIDNASGHGRGAVIEVSLDLFGELVRLTISDDGPGFDESVLPMVFERGFSTTSEGTGLGLHIVRRTVESMGGTVTAMNRVTGGASVQVSLPGRRRAPVATPSASAVHVDLV